MAKRRKQANDRIASDHSGKRRAVGPRNMRSYTVGALPILDDLIRRFAVGAVSCARAAPGRSPHEAFAGQGLWSCCGTCRLRASPSTASESGPHATPPICWLGHCGH